MILILKIEAPNGRVCCQNSKGSQQHGREKENLIQKAKTKNNKKRSESTDFRQGLRGGGGKQEKRKALSEAETNKHLTLSYKNYFQK